MIPIRARRETAPLRSWAGRLLESFAPLACLFALLFVVASNGSAQSSKRKAHTYIPPKGFVADSMTAIRIAEAVLIPIWGADAVSAQKPLVAKLRRGVWVVTGDPPEGMVGGQVELEIVRKDGRMLRTWFSK